MSPNRRRGQGGGGQGGAGQGGSGQGLVGAANGGGLPGSGTSSSSKRRRANKAKSQDIWRPVPAAPSPEPIARVTDPAIVLRSLGDPPLQGQSSIAQHYLAAVVERAAGLAGALAAAAGLLAPPPED